MGYGTYDQMVSVAKQLRCRVGIRKIPGSNPVVETAYKRSKQSTQLTIKATRMTSIFNDDALDISGESQTDIGLSHQEDNGLKD